MLVIDVTGRFGTSYAGASYIFFTSFYATLIEKYPFWPKALII